MKKWKAWAFSSTRKERRPKKPTTPDMACSMCCHPVGGGGGPLGSGMPPARAQPRVKPGRPGGFLCVLEVAVVERPAGCSSAGCWLLAMWSGRRCRTELQD